MHWTNDPQHPWTALYRVVMMILILVGMAMQLRANIIQTRMAERVGVSTEVLEVPTPTS